MDKDAPVATSNYLNAAPRDLAEVREEQVVNDIELRVVRAEQRAARLAVPDRTAPDRGPVQAG